MEKSSDVFVPFASSASFLAPAVLGAGQPLAFTEELKASFCALDPYIARRFAEVTFLGDNRADLERAALPALIIQVAQDAIAPRSVGEYVHRHMPGSEMVLLDAVGHCPHMTHPEETIAVMREFIGRV